MADLTHLFKVGQEVKIKNDDFDNVDGISFDNGVVKETYADHIIVTNIEIDVNGWYEEGLNINKIFPKYNF